jgi:hypothetical protein
MNESFGFKLQNFGFKIILNDFWKQQRRRHLLNGACKLSIVNRCTCEQHVTCRKREVFINFVR